MKTIAIIPARGGSKRIPKKNIKNFAGHPVIYFPIATALKSGLFDFVYVSTDDEEIAQLAIEFGALVPTLRSPELSNDHATTLDVISDAVGNLQFKDDDVFVCCIYPTTPLLLPIYLESGLQKLREGDWDYVVSALKTGSPPERLFKINGVGNIEMYRGDFEFSRTQDLTISFEDAGQFYWGTLSAWRERLPIFSSKSTIVEIPRLGALDVDTQEDWDNLNELYRLQQDR
jgi:pseudaminic acid cytidylyltransferase